MVRQRWEPVVGQDARAWRRPRAWELHQAGWSGKSIAAALTAWQAAVSTWRTRARPGAVAARCRHPRAGRVPKVRAAPRAHLPARWAKGAEADAFSDAGWTTKRVAGVRWRRFEVRSPPAHVRRRVRQEGRRLQNPVLRATPRNEAPLAAWQAETGPALAAKLPQRIVRSAAETRRALPCGPASPAAPRPLAKRRWYVRPAPTTSAP